MSFTLLDVKKRIRLYIKPDVGSLIDDWIRAGQEYLEDELRIRSMQKLTISAIASVNVLAVPGDYIEIITLSIIKDNNRNVLKKWNDIKSFLQNFTNKATTNESKPSAFARIADNFQFNCYPDQVYTSELYYYSKLKTLTLDADTNWFVINAINLLVFASLIEAVPYLLSNSLLPDAGIVSYWQDQRELLLDRVKLRDIKEKIATGKGEYPRNVF